MGSSKQTKLSRFTLFLICFLSGLHGVCSQQRNTNLVWSGQHVHEGRFNVHTFDVFSGANRLTLKIKGTSLDQVERVEVWLRYRSTIGLVLSNGAWADFNVNLAGMEQFRLRKTTTPTRS